MTNETGIYPVGYAILIDPMDVSLSSVIAIPDAMMEREKLGNIKGRIVAIGPQAWKEEDVPRAQVGQTVLITKYAGALVLSPRDGKYYRMINDRDVFGIIDDVEGDAK